MYFPYSFWHNGALVTHYGGARRTQGQSSGCNSPYAVAGYFCSTCIAEVNCNEIYAPLVFDTTVDGAPWSSKNYTPDIINNHLPQWVGLQFCLPHHIAAYQILTGETFGNYPVKYQLQGSNNGEDWTTIDTQNAPNGNVVSVSGHFKFFRIYVTECEPSATYASISSIILWFY